MSITSGTVLVGGSIGNTTGTISNNGTITLTGTYTNDATTNGNGTYNIAGNWTNNGTFIAGTSSVTMNGTTSQLIGGTTSTTFNNLTIAAATDTSAANYKTVQTTMNVAGILTINSGNSLDMVSYSGSTFGGSSVNNGKIRWSASNVYVAGAGTTEFYTNTAGNIAAGTAYGNIWITGTNKTIPAGTAVTATGGTASFGVTVSGGLTIAPTGSLTVTSMDLVNNGTITNDGTVTVQ